jgi:hypothetical protein
MGRYKFKQRMGLVRIVLFVFLAICSTWNVSGQIIIVDPNSFTVTTAPDNTNFEFYSRKLGVNTKATFNDVRKKIAPEFAGTVSYTPASSGNAEVRRGKITKTTNGDVWYVDAQGAGVKLSSAAQSSTYQILDNDQQAAALCLNVYRVSSANPYGLTAGTQRTRVYGIVANCQ